MNDKPLISVIMPVYNCENTIALALESVLNQTYKNLEIIVVNDNSTDNTRSVAEKIASSNAKIKIVDAPDDPERFDKKTGRNINAGYSARNEGFRHAQGELITFQDADDASLLNRIEVQLALLQKHNAMHVATDWIKFDARFLGKKLNLDKFMEEHGEKSIGPEEICSLAKKYRGIIPSISPKINSAIPFDLKRAPIINKLFWGSLESYPGIPGIVLFRREAADKVKFRKRDERIWPSFTGRGADRDFNFQVAETFKKSYVFLIPLFMWRVNKENPRYENASMDNLII